MTPMLDAWAAVMGVSGPLGTMAPARLGASGAAAAEAGLGAVGAGMPALRSLAAGAEEASWPEEAEEAEGADEAEGAAEPEGLEVVAQPARHAVTTTSKSDVMFM